jgi:hypothetical protein
MLSRGISSIEWTNRLHWQTICSGIFPIVRRGLSKTANMFRKDGRHGFRDGRDITLL